MTGSSHENRAMNFESTDEGELVQENEALRRDLSVLKSEANATKSLIRALLSGLPQRLFLKDRNSVYFVANERYATSLGRRVEELLGKDDLALRSPEQAGRSRAADLAVLDSGQVQQTEESEAVEGGVRWVRTTRIPVKSETGEVLAVLGLLEDSTSRGDSERPRAAPEVPYQGLFEAARDSVLILQEQRAILDALLESADFEIFSLDHKYRYTAFNGRHAARMKELYGTAIELGGSQDRYLSAPQEWEQARRRLDRALGGEVFTESIFASSEAAGRQPEQTGAAPPARACETTCQPIRRGEEIIGVSVFARNVAPRRPAAEELQCGDRIDSPQVESSLDGIVVLDISGELVFANPRFAELWGLPPAVTDFSPLLPEVIVQLHEPERYVEMVRRVNATPGSTSHEELILKDGRGVSCNSAPVVSDDGRISGRVWHFTDNTARRQAEVERERTEEQRAAQNLDAAHDFRNLLSVILSYTRFAMDGLDEGSLLREDLQEVRNAAEQAVALTGQLLAISHKQVLKPVRTNLNNIVDGLAPMLPGILGEGVELIHALAPDLGLTLAAPGQLEQIVRTLVANARNAMQGQGQLTIETSNVEVPGRGGDQVGLEQGSYVLLQVTDTGVGKDAQTEARLFEPFFTTQAVGEGPALGLSTVYELVKENGGSVQVQSRAGRGTSFQIFLRRAPTTYTSLPGASK